MFISFIQRNTLTVLVLLSVILVLLSYCVTRGFVAVPYVQAVFLASTTPSTAEVVQKPIIGDTISKQLKGKSSREKANLKGHELSKFKTPQLVQMDGYKGYQVSIEKIEEIDGGIQVFVKAWKNGGQLGFGRKGDVEIERIRMINPPILVRKGDELFEDPNNALIQSILHTVSVIGQEQTEIKKGKIGNTTTTIYPDGGSGGTTVDGRMFQDSYTSWSTAVNAASARVTSVSDDNQDISNSLGSGYGVNAYSLNRLGYGFDTSAIPDNDGIAAATFSVTGVPPDYSAGSERRVYLVSSSPNSNGNLITSDYGNVGSTAFGVTDNVWHTATTGPAYNDIDLNGTGLSYINKTGVTNFAVRGWYDFNSTAPDNSNELLVYAVLADTTGTASDPQLIVQHASCDE